ncbi:DUF2789 family protein [Colwellia sp. MEBiC06753]
MESMQHSLNDLFAQLGLDNSNADIENFVKKHQGLPMSIGLSQATFWSPSQANFIHQAKEDDADWAELVDTLDSMLR